MPMDFRLSSQGGGHPPQGVMRDDGDSMSSVTVGRLTFDLYECGDYRMAATYKCEVTSPEVPIHGMACRAWPLLLESQIGKFPEQLQQIVLESISQQVDNFWNKQVYPLAFDPDQDLHCTATVTVDMNLGKWEWVDVKFKAGLFGAENRVARTIMVSLGHVFQGLDNTNRHWLMFFLSYGLAKWNRVGLPGPITATTRTWDFLDKKGMTEQMREWGFIR